MDYFNAILESILAESEDRYESAVGIVQNRDKWLLGLAKTNDDRNKKWCFPGGHIRNTESPKQAVVREVYEETGIRCRVISDILRHRDKHNVAFLHCKVSSYDQRLKLSKEFYALGWFKVADMRGLKLYPNVRNLIDRIRN
jgi:8-oxo-dGTP diphosphatase